MAVAEVVSLADSMTLYELEESLSLLLESVEEQEELTPELKAAIEQYAPGAAEKRDRVARFLAHCEGQEELAKREIERLQARKKRFENARSRLEDCLVGLMECRGMKKLEGLTATLALRGCPPSVHVYDEEELPAEYKRTKSETVVDKTAIKMALNAGQDVPGAKLVTGRHKLQRK
ncbi:MAG: siphovirus Gp157 family protein [bacterium]|nr:siphovirus Gp157 family protein [bacterium]